MLIKLFGQSAFKNPLIKMVKRFGVEDRRKEADLMLSEVYYFIDNFI